MRKQMKGVLLGVIVLGAGMAHAAMIQAVKSVVHENYTPQEAFELFQQLSNEDE